MKVKLVSIGNSKGIRIPRSIIKACGFEEEVELGVGDGMVVLAPVGKPRQGWDEAFAAMAAAGDDAPVIPESLQRNRDENEWRW
jgi:antitoxin MazE